MPSLAGELIDHSSGQRFVPMTGWQGGRSWIQSETGISCIIFPPRSSGCWSWLPACQEWCLVPLLGHRGCALSSV